MRGGIRSRSSPESPAPECGFGFRGWEREFFIDNLIHFIIVMIRWTGLAPWEFGFPFPGSLTSTFLEALVFVLDLLLNLRRLNAVSGFITHSKVVAQLTLLVAITVLHRSCSVAAEALHR